MAEIEFKRRGTPVWMVLLGILVVALVGYLVFGRGGRTAAPVAADSTATALPKAAKNAPPAPSVSVAPPVAEGGVTKFVAWADRTDLAKTTDVRAPLAEGLRLLTDAVAERAPGAGAQLIMIRAMADTVGMPNVDATKALNAAQAAFFAAGFAMRQAPGGTRMSDAASAVVLTKPLADQRAEVAKFFKEARDAVRNPAASDRAPTLGPPPAAKPGAEKGQPGYPGPEKGPKADSTRKPKASA